jgi:pimeloyl-ACP methyl ester carboxylesterase
VPTFTSPDGLRLAYHVTGAGEPLVCLPGGPGRSSAYLGDLGGLSADRQLIRLDQRGTGDSETPTDSATYRCDWLVDDLEALRVHLGLPVMEVLGHSAGSSVAILYATRYPDRIRRLVLVNPSARAVGLAFTEDDYLASIQRRSDEPWYPEAYAALVRMTEGSASHADRRAAAPFWFGRWTPEAAALADAEATERSPEAAAGFYARAPVTRSTSEPHWRSYLAPVLLVGGDLDPAPTVALLLELGGLFRDARVVVIPGVAHYPFFEAPEAFVGAVR